ncbi:MAG: sugar transferase [Acidobacteriaceae bacterium]|jgi:exopolysaccharide biosynthesis polyprenyl glycosylphosphotransferase|nr:sugar transferase [Acidobacteriaceae bacterium]
MTTNKDTAIARGPMLGGRPLRGISGWICRGGDIAILGFGFFGIVMLPYFAQDNLHLNEFLALRISVRNLLIANVCYWGWYGALYSFGVYTMSRIRSMRDLALKLAMGLTTCTALVGIIAATNGGTPHLAQNLVSYWLVSAAAMTVLRVGLVHFHRYVRPHMRPYKNFIIVGTGPQAQKARREMTQHPGWRYNFLGFVDSAPQVNEMTDGLIIGGLDQLEMILMQRVVDEVVIALPISQYQMVARAVEICELGGVQSQYQSDYFGSSVTKKRYFEGIGATRVVMQVVHRDARRFLKRAIDIVVSILAIIFFSPILIAAAIAVATSPGPIIFQQERYGLNKRKFVMYKFRSMVIDAEKKQAQVEHLNETDGPAFKMKNDPRVTRVGAFMRKLSIDELPQLFNVLIGNMSLVGPRPLPIRDVSRFSEAWLMRRFSVQPGLTCLWQITGRSDTTFDRWVELDLQYIDNWSLGLDARILFMTVPAVLKGKGAS